MANLYSNTQFPGQLSQTQQDLLMAALQSNAYSAGSSGTTNSSTSLDPSMLLTQQDPLYNDVDFSTFEDPQLYDFLDSTGQPSDQGLEQLETNLDNVVAAATVASNDADNGRDKRKSMAEAYSDDDEDDEASPKRREGDEKQVRKPGRKPLTSEPTTKRKAQNRAAQRAFRERKEKHLSDLETKVIELEKTSESTSHENGLLKAQINRLQSELREYRNRLSKQGSQNISPVSANFQSFSVNSAPSNQFQFDFNPSSYVPYGPLIPTTTTSSSPRSATLDYKPSSGFISRHHSFDASSPKSTTTNTPGSTDATRTQYGSRSSPNATSPPAEKLRPGSWAHVASDSTNSYNIFTGRNITESPKISNNEIVGAPSRIFQFNSGSSASPSCSSGSQYGGNGASSSCGTSPEPSTGANKELTGTLNVIDETSKQRQYVDQMGQTNKSSSNPRLHSTTTSGSMLPSSDTFGSGSNPFQLYGTVPDLFSASWSDVPESNMAIQGDSAFTGGFLNDGPSFFESSPMNWNDLTGSMRTGLTPMIQQPNPFETPDVLPSVKEEEVVSGESQLMSCNKLWDAIRQRKDFNDLDIDNLCAELKKKAKCSESGVVIDQADVDEAISRNANVLK